MAITIHLAASVLVMRGILSGRARWLALAIVFHAAVDGVSVYVAGTRGTLATDAIVLGFAALAAAILVFERRRMPLTGAPAR